MEFRRIFHTIKQYYNLSAKIQLSPDYQRDLVWKTKQKQELIFSIIEGMPIPAIYLRSKTGDIEGEDECEVIDGQQRTNAIYDFMNGEFNIKYNGGKFVFYKDLPKNTREGIENYKLEFICVDGREAEIRTLFRRMQNGTPLNKQEIRNSKESNLNNLLEEIAQNPFFNKLNCSLSRYKDRELATQMWTLHNDGIVDLNSRKLDHMIDGYKDLEIGVSSFQDFKDIIRMLEDIFPVKHTGLNKTMALSLFFFISQLYKKYDDKEKIKSLVRDNYNSFLSSEYYKEFLMYSARSTNKKESLEKRHITLLGHFNKFINNYNLIERDGKRNFTQNERDEIFIRDGGKCGIGGERVEYTNFHADHIIPYSKGGRTTISNAQISCAFHNQKKGNKY